MESFSRFTLQASGKTLNHTWISCISHHLVHDTLLTRFKDIVGYIENVPVMISLYFYFGIFSSSTSSSSGRRRKRRLSNKTFEFDLTEDESITEEPSSFAEGISTNEQFIRNLLYTLGGDVFLAILFNLYLIQPL
jgi:hypothetical protein